MGAGVRDAFPPPSVCCCIHSFAYGNAAVRTFGRAHRHRPYGFVWVDCARVVGFVGGWIAHECITEFGRGGACVPARVALQGHIHRSYPAHNACIFGMETPLRGRSGGHAGTAPTVSLDGLRVGGFVCWLVKTVHMNQHHRCCTFDSPGLPTIGDYPG